MPQLKFKLEQLDHQRSHRRPMITHTSDSHQIPSQNKRKSKLQIKKNAKNSNLKILQETLHATHLLKLLDKMYKYEMDSTRTVGATERTRGAGRRGRRTGGRTDGVKPINPPTTSLCRGYNKLFVSPGYKHCGYLSDKTDHMACVAVKWVPMN